MSTAAAQNIEGTNIPILGSLIWYSVGEMEISRSDLQTIFDNHGLSRSHMPNEIRAADAFKRATTTLNSKWKANPLDLGDGKHLVLMVRDVTANERYILKHIVAETRNAKDEELGYKTVGSFKYEHLTQDMTCISQPEYQAEVQEVEDTFKRMLGVHNANHVRLMVNRIVKSTNPTSLRASGGVYFVSKYHTDLIKALAGVVNDTNAFTTGNAIESEFKITPMIDLQDQRDMVKGDFEAQSIKGIDSALDELSEILIKANDGKKKITSKTLVKYVDYVKELTKGAQKYEELLEADLSTVRTKTDLLQQQVKSMLGMVDDSGEVGKEKAGN